MTLRFNFFLALIAITVCHTSTHASHGVSTTLAFKKYEQKLQQSVTIHNAQEKMNEACHNLASGLTIHPASLSDRFRSQKIVLQGLLLRKFALTMGAIEPVDEDNDAVPLSGFVGYMIKRGYAIMQMEHLDKQLSLENSKVHNQIMSLEKRTAVHNVQNALTHGVLLPVSKLHAQGHSPDHFCLITHYFYNLGVLKFAPLFINRGFRMHHVNAKNEPAYCNSSLKQKALARSLHCGPHTPMTMFFLMTYAPFPGKRSLVLPINKTTLPSH